MKKEYPLFTKEFVLVDGDVIKTRSISSTVIIGIVLIVVVSGCVIFIWASVLATFFLFMFAAAVVFWVFKEIQKTKQSFRLLQDHLSALKDISGDDLVVALWNKQLEDTYGSSNPVYPLRKFVPKKLRPNKDTVLV